MGISDYLYRKKRYARRVSFDKVVTAAYLCIIKWGN